MDPDPAAVFLCVLCRVEKFQWFVAEDRLSLYNKRGTGRGQAGAVIGSSKNQCDKIQGEIKGLPL